MRTNFLRILGFVVACQSLMPLHLFSQDGKALIDFEKERKLVILPSIYYAPETQWAFGVVGLGFFHLNKEDSISPVSNAGLSFAYTLNDQILFQAPFNLYFKHDTMRILGEIAYYRYPYFFAGIGNKYPDDFTEKYSASFPRIELGILRKVLKNVYTGPRLFFQNTTMEEVTTNGLLDTAEIVGSKGGLINGLGWDIRIDGRDNVYAPTKGYYFETNYHLFNENFTGSDFNFNRFEFDIRGYLNLGKNHVLALQSYSVFNFGETPFNRLAQLGGSKIMRGYKKGVYRDQLMTAAQLEYRSPIWWRLGFTAFFGVGSVADKFKNFSSQYIRPSYGLGLRAAFNKKERIHIRLDYARGSNRDEFYITLSEAF